MSDELQVEQPGDLPGVPDAFQRLWTPHRMVYIKGENKPKDAEQGEQCPFCRAPGGEDAGGLVVRRGEHCFVVMNLYPYSPGHLLVCPYRHVADYTELTPEETAELARLTQQAMTTLRSISRPAGFNLGMNQGAVAGAGIAAHLHQHVVPRFQGDSNFLPIIAQTRALPQLLEDARQLLSEGWVTSTSQEASANA
ncbi:HIT domain-containing protein [Aestuariimicrobium sp. p3-SID1156]|uniref:HIT family protein n=1 Tax=Aestuariimicrobium sp. p3-SID1156 TaxID=2916038 RepID=UPI00223B5DFF|nr:HIT domain-containing protein [Aestuariimicrobium sp. p3-SID1156]MCT1459018.1 HIT domain-containing protein [Aestuariimicrobium sp. p3-SID1156]